VFQIDNIKTPAQPLNMASHWDTQLAPEKFGWFFDQAQIDFSSADRPNLADTREPISPVKNDPDTRRRPHDDSDQSRPEDQTINPTTDSKPSVPDGAAVETPPANVDSSNSAESQSSESENLTVSPKSESTSEGSSPPAVVAGEKIITSPKQMLSLLQNQSGASLVRGTVIPESTQLADAQHLVSGKNASADNSVSTPNPEIQVNLTKDMSENISQLKQALESDFSSPSNDKLTLDQTPTGTEEIKLQSDKPAEVGKSTTFLPDSKAAQAQNSNIQSISDQQSDSIQSQNGIEAEANPRNVTSIDDGLPADSDKSSVQVQSSLSSFSGQKDKNSNQGNSNPDWSPQIKSVFSEKNISVENVLNPPKIETPNNLDMQENVDRIVKTARIALSRNNSVVQLRLDPPELGTLKIEIKQNASGLNLQIQAGNLRAQQLLQQNANELRTALDNSGIQTNQIEIQLKLDLRNDPSADQNHLNQQNQQQDNGQGQHHDQHQSQQFSQQSQSDNDSLSYASYNEGLAEDVVSAESEPAGENLDSPKDWRELTFSNLDVMV